MTIQLDFLPATVTKPTPPPSKKIPTKAADPVEEPEESSSSGGAKHWAVGKYVNIYTWGVRARNGEWVTAKGDPRRAEYEAKNITDRHAVEIFNTHPEAFQLINGCDSWACLDDTPEVFVVKKEKKDVPAAEAISGASPAGAGRVETPPVHLPAEGVSDGDGGEG